MGLYLNPRFSLSAILLFLLEVFSTFCSCTFCLFNQCQRANGEKNNANTPVRIYSKFTLSQFANQNQIRHLVILIFHAVATIKNSNQCCRTNTRVCQKRLKYIVVRFLNWRLRASEKQTCRKNQWRPVI